MKLNTWGQKAQAYHAKRPEFYDALVGFAREAKAAGATRIGMTLLMGRVRWETALKRSEQFKFNENYAAWYAREIMAREPDLADFFETRELRAA